MPAKRMKSLHRVFVGAAGVGVAEVGEPLDLGRHVGQPVKLGGGQQPIAGGDLGGELVGCGVVVHGPLARVSYS